MVGFLIVEIVEPKKGEKILDPACGTAGFLISAYNKIIKQDLSISEKEELATNGLVGYDINPNMVKLSKKFVSEKAIYIIIYPFPFSHMYRICYVFWLNMECRC